MANEKNLKPQSTRTKEEQRKIARMGGIASGKKRKEQKDLRNCILEALKGKLIDKDGNEVLAMVKIAVSLITRASEGDVNAQKFLYEVVYGKEQKIDVTSSDGSMTPKGGAVFDFSGLTPEERAEIAKAAFLGK